MNTRSKLEKRDPKLWKPYPRGHAPDESIHTECPDKEKSTEKVAASVWGENGD